MAKVRLPTVWYVQHKCWLLSLQLNLIAKNDSDIWREIWNISLGLDPDAEINLKGSDFSNVDNVL